MNDSRELAPILLRWYDRHARTLPWRAPRGERPDPYRVWLAEIMLQQTTVPAVAPFFRRFVARWPTVAALAETPLDDVLRAWAGLGYYARARNLHKCARVVMDEYEGRLPDDEAALRKLPGIGRYTAAAIAAIAFDRPAVVIDGNVERVIARLHAIDIPLPKGRRVIAEAAGALAPASRPGDFAQAMMDLGATICTARAPRCMLCPWNEFCAARRGGEPERYPRRERKRVKPMRRGIAFFLRRADGAVWLRRRPERGLLGGMMEVPSTPWRERAWSDAAARRAAPMALAWHELPGEVRHGFTHFALELKVWAARVGRAAMRDERLAFDDGEWVAVDRLDELALPTLMKKVVAHALKAEQE
ncbi:MAG TPA: A/G-specific adenine glycosylase [Alphaproteobacteria bacterium]|nr:A/G-specific adenine glycosylase [Alphaproteobacteria bacterium]